MIDTICKLIKGRVIFMWIVYAFLSALFAGITAILAKIGIQKYRFSSRDCASHHRRGHLRLGYGLHRRLTEHPP